MEKIDSFYRMGTEFCDYFKENVITDESIDYLISSLMKLYVAALELPRMDTETVKVHNTQKCSIKIDRKFKTTYWEVFDPWEEETPICGTFMMIFLILSEICSAVSKNMIMEESTMLFLSGVSV